MFFEVIGYYNCSINLYEVLLLSDVIGNIGFYYIGIMYFLNEVEKFFSRVLWFCRNGGWC